MDLNDIGLLDGNSLSPSKRWRKENMQIASFLPGFSAHNIPGFPCAQEQTICNPRQEGEKNSVSSVRTSARPNESVSRVILASLSVRGGLHA